MSLRAALGRFFCKRGWLGHLGDVKRDPSGKVNWQCRKCGRWCVPFLEPPPELPEGFLFDWLRDYGPHWHPGSTAFWLEPETCDELAQWHAKYRPEFTGFVEAAGLRIEIVPRRPPVLDRYPYSMGVSTLQQYANQLASMQNAQMQQGLQNAYNEYGQNSLHQILGGLFGNRY